MKPREIAESGLNEGLRLGLKVVYHRAFAYGGWTAAPGPLRNGLAMGLPVLPAAPWGRSGAPDPGDASVAISGRARGPLEGVHFVPAGLAIADSVSPPVGAWVQAVVIEHHLIGRERLG